MPRLRIAELGGVGELADRLCLGAAQLQLGATQPGDGVEELLLGPTPLCQLHLEALVEARVVERDRSHPAEPVEERDLFLVEAGRVAARKADHPQDALGSTERRADERADLHRPELVRGPGVAAEVGSRQRLAFLRYPAGKPLPDPDREPDLGGESADPRHDA